jgi:hypothetical protein
MESLDFSKILAGGAIGGVVLGLMAGFWSKIKAVLWRAVSVLIQQVEIPSEAAHNAVIAFLVKNVTRSRFYDRMYGAMYEHTRDGNFGLVPYEYFGSRSIVFWKGWVPFLFNNEVERKSRQSKGSGEHGSSNSDATKVYSTITFLRGSLDVESILRAACSEMNQITWSNNTVLEQAKNRFVIHFIPSRGSEDDDYGSDSNGLPWYQTHAYRLLAHAREQLGKGGLHQGKALENLIYPMRVQNLIREIEMWRGSKDWYRGRGISWKRGWLLYGPPGTGKTALARAFAEDLNMPIYVFNLAEMTNHDLNKAWNDMLVNVPCIALIEDIDNVFHGRENVSRKNAGMSFVMSAPPKNDHDDNTRSRPMTPLTFDCLLNCIDGVERSDGIFTIITTNDITKVDPALGQPRTLPDGTTEFISTRPGRIDKAVELGYLELEGKKRMARRILGEYPPELAEMLAFVEKFSQLQETPAQFQERCAQVALARFWHDKEALARGDQRAEDASSLETRWDLPALTGLGFSMSGEERQKSKKIEAK